MVGLGFVTSMALVPGVAVGAAVGSIVGGISGGIVGRAADDPVSAGRWTGLKTGFFAGTGAGTTVAWCFEHPMMWGCKHAYDPDSYVKAFCLVLEEEGDKSRCAKEIIRRLVELGYQFG